MASRKPTATPFATDPCDFRWPSSHLKLRSDLRPWNIGMLVEEVGEAQKKELQAEKKNRKGAAVGRFDDRIIDSTGSMRVWSKWMYIEILLDLPTKTFLWSRGVKFREHIPRECLERWRFQLIFFVYLIAIVVPSVGKDSHILTYAYLWNHHLWTVFDLYMYSIRWMHYYCRYLSPPKDLGPSKGRVWTCIAGLGTSK